MTIQELEAFFDDGWNQHDVDALMTFMADGCVFEGAAGTSTKSDVNPNYILPKQALLRLQKIMDEYGAGRGAYYMTNEPTLNRGLQLLDYMREDLNKMAARDQHDLLRCWEVRDRFWCAEAHLRHILFRKEVHRCSPALDNQQHPAAVCKHFSAECHTNPLRTDLGLDRRVLEIGLQLRCLRRTLNWLKRLKRRIGDACADQSEQAPPR